MCHSPTVEHIEYCSYGRCNRKRTHDAAVVWIEMPRGKRVSWCREEWGGSGSDSWLECYEKEQEEVEWIESRRKIGADRENGGDGMWQIFTRVGRLSY